MADDVAVSSAATYTVAADDVGSGVLAQIVKLAYSADGSRVLLQVDANGVLVNIASLPLPALAATSTIQTTQQTSLTSLDGKTPALGQALAASSSPVVLTAAQLSTLTPLGTVALGAGSAVVGHVINDASSAVIGHVIADTGSTTAVTGNVAVTSAGLTNLDVALSTRTKPADQQHAIIDSGTVTTVTTLTGITNALPAGANVIGHVLTDTGSTTAVTGTVAISAATLPLPTSAATETTQLLQATAANQVLDMTLQQAMLAQSHTLEEILATLRAMHLQSAVSGELFIDVDTLLAN